MDVQKLQGNINDLTNSVIRAVKSVIDKHAPIRITSTDKQKQLRKPWITNAILISINLDVQKASLDIPKKLIKIAAEPLSKPLAFINTGN